MSFPLAMVSLILAAAPGPPLAKEAIAWEPWSEAVFPRAAAEHKLVLLDLEAVWCHWCHVMDETTYQDPRVIEAVRSRYLAVRVDQDGSPALADRYERWGWPATIVFAADGSELAKRRGYLPPEKLARLLEALGRDPTPGPSVEPEPEVGAAQGSALPAALRQRLLQRIDEAYDAEHGGWPQGHGYKLIDADLFELAMLRSSEGRPAPAQQTLEAALQLVDPQWGGVYQYSDALDWRSPHYEKIMSVQADALRSYAAAYQRWGKPEYLKAAQGIERYLAAFLTSPEGAFYVSQDADLSARVDGHAYFPLPDAERRKLGLPRVDAHLYARENGWAIAALASLADATGEAGPLQRAIRAARWVTAHRSLPGGGFQHGDAPGAAPMLGDSLAMGQAYLALHAATGERTWLTQAQQTAAFIEAHFAGPGDSGYISAEVPAGAVGVFRTSLQHEGENASLARWAWLLFHYTGSPAVRAMAERAMRHVAAPGVVGERGYWPEALLADRELAREPLHITVVGAREDPAARALFAAARRVPTGFKRTDWLDRREAPLPNLTVAFPPGVRAAAYVCGRQTCSLPAFTPERLAAAVESAEAPPGK